MNTFQIGDYTFEIDEVNSFIRETSGSDINDNYIFWDLSIATKEGDFDGHTFSPSLRGDKIIVPEFCLDQCQNRTIDLGGYRAENEDVSFTLYLAKHSETHHNTIEFGTISNGKITIHWKGLCDLYWDDKGMGQGVPFHIICDLPIQSSISPDDFVSPSLFTIQGFESIEDMDEDDQENFLEECTDLVERDYLTDTALSKVIEFIIVNLREGASYYDEGINLFYSLLRNNAIEEKRKAFDRFNKLNNKDVERAIVQESDDFQFWLGRQTPEKQRADLNELIEEYNKDVL